MIKFDFLSKWKDSIHLDINPFVVVPAVLIVAVIVGYAYFFISTLYPSIQASDKLTTQLATAQKAVTDARRAPETNPDKVQQQVVAAQATLTNSLSVFLSDRQSSDIVNALYQYANTSGVKIANLQTQPATGQKGLYSATVIRLQIQGDSSKLVDFVSRIRESFAAQGFVINNINLSGGDMAVATLALDVALYTTSIAGVGPSVAEQPNGGGSAAPVSPAIPNPTAPPPPPTAVSTPIPLAPTQTPVPPTATVRTSPTASYIAYVVRAGDTLYSIAVRYGVTMEAIGVANHLSNYNLRVGQTLLIPQR